MGGGVNDYGNYSEDILKYINTLPVNSLVIMHAEMNNNYWQSIITTNGSTSEK